MNERTDRMEGACRPTVELLPWYVNGTLEAEESHRVERHLAGCAPCRGELALCREMAAAIPAGESLAPASHPARLARLMERLGEPPADGERPSRAAGIAGRLRRWRESVTETAPPVRWLMAGQLAAIAVLGVALVTAFLVLGGGEGSGIDPAGSGRTFRTLTDTPESIESIESTAPAPVPAAGSTRIRVVFDPSLTEADIRSLLLELRAQVVGGPSPLGAYTLEVPAGGADADPPEVVLDHLRAQPGVRFAEPAVAP
jgi:hypothetical protein